MDNREPRRYFTRSAWIALFPLSVRFSTIRLNTIRIAAACLLATAALQTANADPSFSPSSAKIAIIIDDLGYRLAEGKRAIRLAGQVTLSILPFSPHAKQLAHMAIQHRKEVMLHAPMTPLARTRWEAGLANDMDREQLVAALHQMLVEIPEAKGLNNHGGSRFTQDRERMVWLMTDLKERGLFFIDSRTTANTAGIEAAQEVSLPYNERDIFLDNDLTEEAIVRQLDRLVAIAIEHGQAIAIGHPHRETLDVLEAYLPALHQQGIELVDASRLLKIPPVEQAVLPEKETAPKFARLKPANMVGTKIDTQKEN